MNRILRMTDEGIKDTVCWYLSNSISKEDENAWSDYIYHIDIHIGDKVYPLEYLYDGVELDEFTFQKSVDPDRLYFDFMYGETMLKFGSFENLVCCFPDEYFRYRCEELKKNEANYVHSYTNNRCKARELEDDEVYKDIDPYDYFKEIDENEAREMLMDTVFSQDSDAYVPDDVLDYFIKEISNLVGDKEFYITEGIKK